MYRVKNEFVLLVFKNDTANENLRLMNMPEKDLFDLSSDDLVKRHVLLVFDNSVKANEFKELPKISPLA